MNFKMNLKALMYIIVSKNVCSNHRTTIHRDTYRRRETRSMRQYRQIKVFLITHISARNIISQSQTKNKYPSHIFGIKMLTTISNLNFQ